MKLLIAIPAYNEEASIQSTIERSLAARDHIIERSPVTSVELIVVSDGSTDRTVELARRYAGQVRLVVFETNRGYGAAIKEAWSQSSADLLGFLDADGTCDPMYFADLCTALVEENADVAVGCRMTVASRMPLLRRIGNFGFALLLGLVSSKRVRDTASGMRVVRRSSLPRLMPLPDGLHFTPAMSARAALSSDLKMVERDIPYHEREGRSKLRLIRDGLRFLRVIAEAACLYRPSLPLAVAGGACLAAAAALMAMPVAHYLQHRSVLEWMIYRFVVSDLLGKAGVLLLVSSYLSRRIVAITLAEAQPPSRGLVGRLLASPGFWLAPVALALAGVYLVVPSLLELVTTGATYEHWSRFVAMSFLVSVAILLAVARALDYSLDLIAERVRYLRSREPF